MSATGYRGKKVLVTGAGGFIGSHLVQHLLAQGAEVRGLLHYNSRNDLANLRHVPEAERREIDLVFGDLQELETVRSAMRGVDIVFNLAALVGIPYSYVHPQETVQVNTVGTLNVLIAARDADVSRVIQTSTSEVYGTARYAPIDEKHPKQPQSPYSASKIASDAVSLSFHHSFDLPVALIRPFNTYGPRQSLRAVIPVIAAQALHQDQVRLGNLHPTRDFTFVLDLVRAFAAMGQCDEAIGRELNVGSGQEISIGELAERIIRISGRDVELVADDQRIRPAASEVERLIADSSASRELLGWEPQVSLDEGLAQVVDFVREAVDPSRASEYFV